MPVKSHREFRAHPQHLRNTVLRQAGDLWKAVLEGVMNSVDAGASRCDITLNQDRVKIVDDGRGFQTDEEIANHFETFGSPHEEGDATYGEFRMGRGQLMAFGRNVWRSNQFTMTVDVKNAGMCYGLEVAKSSVFAGCEIVIDLYEPLLSSGLLEAQRELAKFVKYVSIPVYLNGEQISVDPSTVKWDHVTDEAYIRLRDSGDLHVYNLGVFVNALSANMAGAGGEVVSRKRLKLNFARNDVMRRGHERCPVWLKIEPYLRQTIVTRNSAKPSLNDAGRAQMAREFVDGNLPYPACTESRLLTDVTGRHWCLQQLRTRLYQFHNRYSNAPLGNRLGDRVQQMKLAFVFSDETLSRFNVATVTELWALFTNYRQAWPSGNSELFKSAKYVAFSDLTEAMSTEYHIVPQKEQSLMETCLLAALGTASWHFARFRRATDNPRKLVVGLNDTADGWTDGRSYIAINRKFLDDVGYTTTGLLRICQLLAHEYCHDGPDTAEHPHSHEFYQDYHDLSDAVVTMWEGVVTQFPKVLARAGKRLSLKVARSMDRDEVIRKGLDELRLAARVRK